ncbi:hypothetical protein N7539_006825 [Penicillium diatomitis]|uniref:Phenazine biosynthesis-like protein n=1 Tax=Penicillium diatomitis TaxID=2819901 RepID=A0A9W9X351_9EURO|nr:uncharacterized protein N7539_006825 [Penicillium diatomitis]KAJ5480931.1 hypothetical protein N7539_006825 [Penicillium diatomitis]
MLQLKYLTLDVFTTQPFQGNPLAVVFLPSDPQHTLTQRQKHLLCLEFNLSETIFVHPVTDPNNSPHRTIDIFTIECEIPFAGHPTIGAASWFLVHGQQDPHHPVTSLITKSGEIPISVQDAQTGAVAARIAHNTRIHAQRFPLAELLALHPTVRPYLNESESKDFPLFSIVNGMSQLFIELPSLEALAAVTRPTGAQLIPTEKYLDAGWQSGLICVYFYVRDVEDEKMGGKVIRTRMMLSGIEDPATGSSASGLAAYLALTEGEGRGKQQSQEGGDGQIRYHFVQGVEMGRRSDIGVNVRMEGGFIQQVELTGTAVRVSEGVVAVPEVDM